ncbi:hypothetical protein [Tsukamurella pseudospumae]|uniref:ESX-1 secretion-associated protein n=1 Tax=Tsukamurella pseudospumae TaxID=239498 RepID=A0A138AU39_9ACTN|nr:hypothetical protein [Tsukamurella pseudospumae]KXP13929.1 hypothetical protein AXK60_22765 [Tsukamurella pseudospumae]
MGSVSIADLDQLDSIADQAMQIHPTLEALASGQDITGTANCRWGSNAANAYIGFNAAAKKATKDLAALIPEQVAVIRAYTKRERELQQKTKRESDQLGQAIPQMPKVEPSKPTTIAGGAVEPDGTVHV